MGDRKTLETPSTIRDVTLMEVSRELTRILDEVALAPRWEETSGYKFLEDVYITEQGSGVWFTKNAVYDGTNWVRLDTTEPSFALVMELGTDDQFVVRTAAAGANPIVWNDVLRIQDQAIGRFGVAPVGQQGPLTAQDNSTVDATYGAEEEAVIKNLRTRQGEIESALQALGDLQ